MKPVCDGCGHQFATRSTLKTRAGCRSLWRIAVDTDTWLAKVG